MNVLKSGVRPWVEQGSNSLPMASVFPRAAFALEVRWLAPLSLNHANVEEQLSIVHAFTYFPARQNRPQSRHIFGDSIIIYSIRST